MKIAKKYLRRIIKEEKSALLREATAESIAKKLIKLSKQMGDLASELGEASVKAGGDSDYQDYLQNQNYMAAGDIYSLAEKLEAIATGIEG